MFDEPRRRLLLWVVSLPLVVATVWFALVLLAECQRGDLIAQLGDVAAHGSTEEAAAAVRQLAAMPRPPIATLVAAASSPTRAVAVEAQLAINDLVRRWQRQVKAGRQQRVANQMSTLVDELAQQQSAFSTADYPWLGRTTQRIIVVANGFPPEASLPVAQQCEAILANIESANAAVPVLTSAATIPPGEQAAAAAIAASSPQGQQPSDISRSALAISQPSDSASRLLLPDLSGWWQHLSRPTAVGPATHGPSLAIAGRSPSSAPDAHTAGAAATTEPASAASDSALASLKTRALVARWLAADAAAAPQLERELARRGFGRLPTQLVEQLLSPDAQVRQQLVENLLALPDVDARPWLMLLADDENADVRLAAVSMMATSNDPQLIEKAWQVALHDRDPRIANLAPRLRDRQAGLQQR